MPTEFWSRPLDELMRQLGTRPTGLAGVDARRQLAVCGQNIAGNAAGVQALRLFANQFTSPVIALLLFATALSFFLGDTVNGGIILGIVLTSAMLGFWQEYGASLAVRKLIDLVQVRSTVLRDGQELEVPVGEVVPGDVVRLRAGALIPADGVIVASRDLFVDEASLTGETYPAEKACGISAAEAPLAKRSNAIWMGTHVVSGTADALIVQTGAKTEFGKVCGRLKLRPPITEFEAGIRHFGYFLMRITVLLVMSILAINLYLRRPLLESLLFSLALAVGLTPQLLPVIISVNLARGARRMASFRVIVKRLASIESFGSMDVLCADKTGTLTEGIVKVEGAYGVEGKPSERVLLHACLNASMECGFVNPIDGALRVHCQFDLSGYRKLDEIPYDFVRKRLSILVAHDSGQWLISKGAVQNVRDVCSRAEVDGAVVDIGQAQAGIEAQLESLSRGGRRILAVACRKMDSAAPIGKNEEQDMTLLGFVVLFDPPKAGVNATIDALRDLGVTLKIVTGDSHQVAGSVGAQVGLDATRMLTGSQLRELGDDALVKRVGDVDLFAEIEPNQKERIILALRKAGHVVGFLGDGINDASGLHAADVGISVDGAVDVAKEAADIVLLEKDLAVLCQGVREGRTTFANTLKYVFMATSANFGNMFSMAGAALVLPYLPLLPTQILLTNLLTDGPEMAIAGDRVDEEMVRYPRRWNLVAIRKFMLTFGLLSSLFDLATFAVLLVLLRVDRDSFRTGWFVESVVSAALIVLVIRSRKPFFRSRPSPALTWTTLAVVLATVCLPFTALGKLFGFVPLSATCLLSLAAIVACYIPAAELLKQSFYRRVSI
jgi:Mg2+-importing ATPase